MRPPARSLFAAIALTLLCGAGLAQAPSVPPPDPPAEQRFDFRERWGEQGAAERPARPGAQPITPSTAQVDLSEIGRDIAALPEPVQIMRERLIAAARSGDVGQVAALIAESPVRVAIDQDGREPPQDLWRRLYPESEGLEVLAILIGLLETGFVQVERGSPNEMFVWPYFAHVPLQSLQPPHTVELYRIVTAFDHQQMLDAGTWTFFRIGIAPDGTLHYFLAGE